MRRVPSFVGALVLSVIVAQPSSAGSPTGNSTGGVLPPEPGSGQDQAFVIAKEQGRVRVHPDGRVEILSTAPAVTYPSSVQLDTTWTGKVWEPQGSGTDDASHAYIDNNYWNFCGPGATAVALWYWPNGKTFDTGIAIAAYSEPNTALATHASTTWAATDGVSNGRGAIMYLAENELPTRTCRSGPGPASSTGRAAIRMTGHRWTASATRSTGRSPARRPRASRR